MSIKQNFLICLAGLPASGKSIFANELRKILEKKFTNFEIKIIDPDMIRQTITQDKFDYEKEHLVKEKNLQIIKRELKEGSIVISDDLNYYSSMRHDLKKIADDLNLKFFIIHISTPLEVCLKWNDKRGNPIPNKIIKRISKKFDDFNKYKWDTPYAVYNMSQTVDLNDTLIAFVSRLQLNVKQSTKILEEEAEIRQDSNLYKEKLDKITRNYVGTLLLNSNYTPLKNKIIRLRKEFLKTKKNEFLSDSEIQNSFQTFLEESLRIKIL
ncbi:MAG: adenylyl-sulfate kinase [Candidatus Hodarchaeota archaeon]